MIKIKYVGSESHNLAQIGLIEAGQVFDATEKQCADLLKHAPESYVRHEPAKQSLDDDDDDDKPVVPVAPPKAKEVSKPGPARV